MPCHNLIFNRSRLCYCGFWVCHKTPHSCFRQHALWLHLPTTLLSITLETTLTRSLAHSLRSPLRALAPDRKGVHFFSDRVFANRHPSMVKRTHQKEQRSYEYMYAYVYVYMYTRTFLSNHVYSYTATLKQVFPTTKMSSPGPGRVGSDGNSQLKLKETTGGSIRLL